jgi:hypothetical protein
MQGLFNWEPSAAGDGDAPVKVVNSRFWIYWATALPLTAVTLIGWAIWWRIEMRRYPDEEGEKASAPPGFAAQIMETLGWQPADVVPAATEKRMRDNFVFGGRRRQSKLGVDGNPSESEIIQAEAGARQSPYVSPKSPGDAASRPLP